MEPGRRRTRRKARKADLWLIDTRTGQRTRQTIDTFSQALQHHPVTGGGNCAYGHNSSRVVR